MDWLDEIEARGYTNDLTPNDVYLLLAEVRRLREVHSVDVNKMIATETEVDAAPTIDPVRNAKWVDVEILDVDDEGISYTMTWYKCSACGWRVLFNFQKSNHCPNCGARMDGEGEKDE